jgi:hypothetical protein
MTATKREIGPIGTAARVAVGLGLIYLALSDPGEGLAWDLAWYEAALGLVAFPTVMMIFALVGRRFSDSPLHLMGPLGLALNTAVIVALLASDYTRDAALLFYGVALPVAAWRGLAGCEITVLSNWALRREDQIGCPLFAPVDAAETELRRRRAPGAGVANNATSRPRWGRTLAHLGACCGAAAVVTLALIFL